MSFRRRPESRALCAMTDKKYHVYILASRRNGTLYVGITSDLVKRVYDHKNKVISGFTKELEISTLVYFETYDDAERAIHREKCIKEWKRDWKLKLIEENNPQWKDLYERIVA